MINVDIVGPCDSTCKVFDDWTGWCYNLQPYVQLHTDPGYIKFVRPIALMPAMFYSEYMHHIGSKSRNIVRRSASFYYGTFEYNEKLNDIAEINRSMPNRQGRSMSVSYVVDPEPIIVSDPWCDHHHKVWIGAFTGDKIVAYCELVILNELAVLNKFLGHGDYLKYGIMYGLISRVSEISYHAKVRYINYLRMESATPELKKFKHNIGFRPEEAIMRIAA